MADDILSRMRGLIGRRFDYLGSRWTLIEVLADERTVVLSRSDAAAIQVDQFGRANRRGGETLLVPIFERDGETLSPEMMDLLVTKV
ncbi:MAG: hypothetical protein PVF91_06380 [Chromatiales bacterium]|jgi:hypothetical protein